MGSVKLALLNIKKNFRNEKELKELGFELEDK